MGHFCSLAGVFGFGWMEWKSKISHHLKNIIFLFYIHNCYNRWSKLRFVGRGTHLFKIRYQNDVLFDKSHIYSFFAIKSNKYLVTLTQRKWKYYDFPTNLQKRNGKNVDFSVSVCVAQTLPRHNKQSSSSCFRVVFFFLIVCTANATS